MDDVTVEVRGGHEAAAWLRTADDRLDSWLHDLVDHASEYGAERLVQHAPGSIKDLVSIDRAGDAPRHERIIEAATGVHPDYTKDVPGVGLGSNPADYPFFVDAGTGIYGEFGTPITAFPGGVMGPIEYGGRMIYARSIKGQPAQDYSGASFRDTSHQMPDLIAGSLGELAGR